MEDLSPSEQEPLPEARPRRARRSRRSTQVGKWRQHDLRMIAALIVVSATIVSTLIILLLIRY